MSYDPYAPPERRRPEADAPGPWAPRQWAPGPWTPPAPGQPYPPYGYPPPPPRTNATPWVLGVVASVLSFVLLAVLAGVGIVVVRDVRDRVDPQTRARVQAEIPRLTAYVEKERGLRFRHAVDVDILGDRDFVDALHKGSSAEPIAATKYDYDTSATFDALRLVDSGTQFGDDLDADYDDSVVGFYDEQTKSLVVRGTSWDPLVEVTLVHELTHAVQDQNFNLAKLIEHSRADDESNWAVHALVEGDARAVEDSYVQDQSRAWQKRLDAIESNFSDGASGKNDDLITSLSAAPYVLGERFVNDLFDAGGDDAVDKAFTRPPTTSEQILDAKAWYDGARSAEPHLPAFPPAEEGKDIVDRGVLGVTGLAMLTNGGDLFHADTDAFAGWLGDRYTTWYSGDYGTAPCIDAAVAFDSAAAAETAMTALKPWIDREGTTARHETPTLLELRACG